MARRLVFLFLMVTLVTLAAGALFTVLFPQEDEEGLEVVRPRSKPKGRPRAQLPPMTDGGTERHVGGLPAHPVERQQAEAEGPMKVVEATGVLERRGPGQQDAWSQVAVGETLHVEDSVRTGKSGAAVIRVGQSGKVKVAARSELRFKQVGEGVVKLKLQEGRVVAEAAPEAETLFQVETQGSDAVAETRTGQFSMMSDGHGQVAVATETGQVRFRAKGREVALAAGTQSTVATGAAPQAPAPIPKTLLLKVAPPVRTVQREAEQDVEGEATPGSMVRVKGRTIRVDDAGRFRLKVPLDEGSNTVEVAAVDALGRERTTSFVVTVDRSAPPLKGVMTWGSTSGAVPQ